MGIELVFALYDGGLEEGPIRMLNRLGDGIHDGVILEVGGYQGKSSCALALHAHVPVITVGELADADRTAWLSNLTRFGLAARVQPINMPSQDVAKVWDKPIALLFLDGDPAQAEAELAAWLPYVMRGGLVALRHSDRPEVQTAVAKYASGLQLAEADGSTVVYRSYFRADGGQLTVNMAAIEAERYESYTYRGLTLAVRRGIYNPVDKHALQDAFGYDLPAEIHTFIDAGAHIGTVTCLIKQKFPDALGIALEPEPGNFELLGRNAPSGVTLLNGPLSYDSAKKYLAVDRANSGGHTLMDEPIGATVEIKTAYTLEQIMTGDFERIDFLKMDIEGCEMDVLLSARADRLRHIHFIGGERHFTHEEFLPVIQRLEALGFQVEDKPHYELSIPPWNMTDRGVFRAVNLLWNTPVEDIVAEYNASDYRQPAKYYRKRR